jgi:hypothetical protein
MRHIHPLYMNICIRWEQAKKAIESYFQNSSNEKDIKSHLFSTRVSHRISVICRFYTTLLVVCKILQCHWENIT